MSQIERKAQFMATADRLISKITHAPVLRYNAGEGTPFTEIHQRGGEMVGVRHSDGTYEWNTSRTVVHKYDVDGGLSNRYVVGRPQEGSTVLPRDQMPPSFEIYRNTPPKY